MKKQTLKPTLWRTCRALMNPERLQLFRLTLENDGQLCVRDYAKILHLPDSIASIYLRQLNARGLLGVSRDRIKVFYNADNDRTLPDAAAIQKTLVAFFSADLPDGWESELMTILRAFSHFNRLAILTRLARGPARMDDLFKAMGVCVKSVYHHLAFLHAAGLVAEERSFRSPSLFHLVRPTHPLARTLLGLTLGNAESCACYYNPGSGSGTDKASRATLKKIRRAEGRSRSTWKACGRMKPTEIHVPANAKSWAGMKEWQGKKLVFDAK